MIIAHFKGSIGRKEKHKNIKEVLTGVYVDEIYNWAMECDFAAKINKRGGDTDVNIIIFP